MNIRYRKIYVAVTLFFIIGSAHLSYAQERFADCRVKILSPEEGTTVMYPNWIQVTFSIYNQGPDTLIAEDEYLYKLTQSYNDSTNGNRRKKLNRLLFPGDSIIVYDSVPITRNKDYNSVKVFFTPKPSFFNNNPGSILRAEIGDELNDNADRVILKQIKNTANVLDPVDDEQRLLVYPNPIQGSQQIRIEAASAVKYLSLINPLGQEVFVRSMLNEAKANVFLDSHPAGVYTLLIATEEGLVTKKFMIL